MKKYFILCIFLFLISLTSLCAFDNRLNFQYSERYKVIDVCDGDYFEFGVLFFDVLTERYQGYICNLEQEWVYPLVYPEEVINNNVIINYHMAKAVFYINDFTKDNYYFR